MKNQSNDPTHPVDNGEKEVKSRPSAKPPERMSFTPEVYRAIRESIGRLAAEHGGMLGGNRRTGEITHFYLDTTAIRNGALYTPDAKLLTSLLEEEWNPKGIDLLGFVHSHPPGFRRPSGGDELYARRILEANSDLSYLFLPIVLSESDSGKFELLPYLALRTGDGVTIAPLNLGLATVGAPGSGRGHVKRNSLVSEAESPSPQADRSSSMPVADSKTHATSSDRQKMRSGHAAATEISSPANHSASEPAPAVVDVVHLTEAEKQRIALIVSTYRRGMIPPRIEIPRGYLCANQLGRTFARVRHAYDLDWLAHCRVVLVGLGGAAAFAEDAARWGVGEFALTDPDTVCEENLATQQVYRRDIGRPKVECIAERIRDINPAATVVSYRKELNDFSDDECQMALFGYQVTGFGPPAHPPHTRRITLLCGFTDDFYAQARINRLALQFGLPSLCAQVYREGRAAEVTFTFPGVTRACHRCILSSRYKAYLERRFKNDVGSQDCPLVATSRLNALKGIIALAILHYGSNQPRWGNLLGRIGIRNLCQIRMDPDVSESLGFDVFDRVFQNADRHRLICDEAVWLPQQEESPDTGYPYHCPDCGGTGDLRNAAGRFADTRIMPPDRPDKATS